MDTTCNLVNQSPTLVLVGKTLHEAWTSERPFLKHLNFFGCDTYVYTPKENKSKLDNKAEKCIFISYKHGVKGFKIWNHVTKEIVYSRDVFY